MGDSVARQSESGFRSQRTAVLLAAVAALCLLPGSAGAGAEPDGATASATTTTQTYTISGEVC